ncbi:MAG TPA: hypothetical protein VGJ90_08975 [Methylophilaceae bacterium]|jgi:hypothetical protein
MKNIIMSGLLVSISMSAFAGSVGEKFSSSDNNKGTLIAVTERGPGAKMAAHILQAQLIQHPAYMPEFLALEGPALDAVMTKYGLTNESLPAYIFVDRRGHELGRIAGQLPTAARLVANNSQLD